ncbi:MAG: SpoIIE family protein phosphatase [Deltaproteobacteria bacterium]|nr:SpoIIE family protein phosphatase [Deltaproteobacteria bacterium]
MMRFRSLQQRFSMFMLLPVGILLLSMGLAGFVYARNRLLTQWGEATILKLQRAAHHVDMRLSSPKQMLKMFHDSAGLPHAAHVQGLILEQLSALEWVTRVNLTWLKTEGDRSEHVAMYHHMRRKWGPQGVEIKEEITMMPFQRGRIVAITPPRFDASKGRETVNLISDLIDDTDQTIGKLEVEIGFDYFVDTVEATGWWREHKAFLVDDSGKIFTSNLNEERKQLAENNDPLERSTLYSMKSLPFGTVFGQGFPPQEISGFYKLKEAPWTLVIIVPGGEILSAIVNFRVYYFIFGGVFIIIILFLIRFVTGRTVSSIVDVSDAAKRVALGDYEVSLPVKTHDEVGELTLSFNTMVGQLEDRVRLQNSLNLAKEVQQNLLPEKSFQFQYLDIAGQSLYCDETGGDYYDYIWFPEMGEGKIGIAVGDVADHGIAAALFMTTARAFIRSKMRHSIDLARTVNNVNRLLCMDTAYSGNFMTFFLMLIDTQNKELRWIRAGHDPATLYNAASDKFVELGGEGIALGVNEDYTYEEYRCGEWDYGQIVLIGTDGIWDTENSKGERFGKERMRRILQQMSHASAAHILKAVTDAVADFRQGNIQDDDVTLVIVKAKS